jgi:ketosteroid isomerase-like protein
VRTVPQHPRLLTFAVGLVGLSGAARAEPPPTPESKGGFMSSLTQAFRQDIEHEVVRGHFDAGTPPDTHRYYCLVDPKTGRNEPNGVAGEPVKRADGMTGIKGGAVSPLSCADAEQKGLLVTAGYLVKITAKSAARSARDAPVAPAAPAVPPAPPASAPVLPQTPAATDARTNLPEDESAAREVAALFRRFVAGQNARDRAAVSATLLDSKDFVWAQSGGGSIWGHGEAMEAFERDWKGSWKLEPQLTEVRIASLAPDAALLVTPLLFTSGNPGEDPTTVPVRWACVFLKTRSGWRIASIFTTPFKSWHAAAGR